MNRNPLARRALAEFIGTAFLVAAVIGSGIAASAMSPADRGLQLFENAAATAAALTALILALAPVSGAHLNPIVTVVDRLLGTSRVHAVGVYVVAQVSGAVLGAIVANLMFGLPAVDIARTDRTGAGMILAEVVATFGLVMIVFALVRSGREGIVAVAVGAYIGAAYFFTSSTSFANPAVTLARTLSDTFAGIAPASVPPFLVAQVAGGMLALVVVRVLYPPGRVTVDSPRTRPQRIRGDER